MDKKVLEISIETMLKQSKRRLNDKDSMIASFEMDRFTNNPIYCYERGARDELVNFIDTLERWLEYVQG